MASFDIKSLLTNIKGKTNKIVKTLRTKPLQRLFHICWFYITVFEYLKFGRYDGVTIFADYIFLVAVSFLEKTVN